MKKLFLFTFLFLLNTSIFAWRDGEMEVRVYYDDPSQLQQLIALDFAGDIYPDGHALIYVIESELIRLQQSGLRYVIEKDDLITFAQEFWQSMDNTREAYHTWSEIIALADSLAAAFPNICAKHVYGTSLGGKELGALKISNNVNLDENEAEIMFDGGIHGDEIGGPENCIRFARDLCLAYGVDPAITNLIDNREIWIYYMVNPDGRPTLNRYNNNGVDINRDAGYMWDAWGGSTGAFSQVESKVLRDITFERNFTVHTTYHSGSEAISYPWSYRASQCPDYNHIDQLAGIYSALSGYANLPYYQGNTGMYAINGSTKDTNYGALGSISWSIEISMNKQPPASQLLMYYNHNKQSMLAMIENAGYGLEGIVTDAITGEPVAAIAFVNNFYPCYTDAAVGDYHKYVLPGVYDITVMANGYQTQTINGISVSANSSTATDFQLVPAEGQFVYKIRSSHIPNNNPADIADTPGVIGEPDGRYYSIGKNGWIVVDMQYPIIDGPGNDLCVYEGDASPEGYTVFAGSTPDGPWVSLGNGLGTTEFDLSVAGIAEVQFLKILDDGDGVANVSGAGFDLDTIAALESLSGVYLALVDYFVDDSVGNNNGRLDPGETADIIVTIRNNGDIMAENVSGLISTTNPWISLDVDSFNFGDIQPLQTSEGIFTITANLLTPSGESFDLALAVNANAGAYTNNFTMSFVVGGYLIEEYFDSFPPAGWTTSGGSNWQGGTGNYAGGTAPEARFYWSPSTTAIQRLISHQINTTGSSTLQLEFKHNLDHYGGPYSIKVQTTSDGNTWNDAWSIVNPTGNIGPELVEVEVSTPDVGSSTFQIAWVFDGYSWNLNNWYVDDVILGGGSAASFGTLSGIVTDGVSGLPLAGVSVNGYTNSGTAGNYTIDLIPGTYVITFSLDGYYDYTEENVEIIADETTTLNVSLTPIPTIDPPENFAGVVQNFNDVLLTWTIPGGTTQELYYHNGYDNNGIGTNRAADWICAARFTADELAAYYGTWELTDVNIFLHSMDFSYVGIQVYEGGSFGNPGTLVYDQDITTSAVALDFTNHLLSTPIPLVAGNEYWIGYEMSATGDHPAAVDAGPAVAGKGDWMYYSSIWQEISVAFGLNYNWVITGVVTESSDLAVNRPKQSKTIGTTARAQRNLANSNAPMEVHHRRPTRVTAPATETTRALTGYTIYRDGTEIGSVAAAILQYLDSGLNAGTYNYTIVANYDEGNSDPAGPVEVIVTLPAPTGVSVISNWPNVLVQWIPLSRALESYNIYQNDELVGNTTLNFIIITEVPAGIHSYNVAAVFSSGWEGDWSDTMILFHFDPVGADPNLIPLVTSLEGNYPNPFNPSTTIKFGLSESANVMLEIYNIRGEKVRTLINEELPAKYHSVSWNGRDDNNKSVSSGVYFYKMRAGNYVSTRKMILMK